MNMSELKRALVQPDSEHTQCDCRSVRDEEDAFSTDVFQSLRSAYKRGVLHTVRGKSKEAQAAAAAAAAVAEERIGRARAAAAREHAVARARELSAERAKMAAECAQVWRCRLVSLASRHFALASRSQKRVLRTCRIVSDSLPFYEVRRGCAASRFGQIHGSCL